MGSCCVNFFKHISGLIINFGKLPINYTIPKFDELSEFSTLIKFCIVGEPTGFESLI